MLVVPSVSTMPDLAPITTHLVEVGVVGVDVDLEETEVVVGVVVAVVDVEALVIVEGEVVPAVAVEVLQIVVALAISRARR